MRTRYRLLASSERGKHSPKEDVLVADAQAPSRYTLRNVALAWMSGMMSYLPWAALSLLVTGAVMVILNSGMSVSDITHLFTPLASSVGGALL